MSLQVPDVRRWRAPADHIADGRGATRAIHPYSLFAQPPTTLALKDHRARDPRSLV